MTYSYYDAVFIGFCIAQIFTFVIMLVSERMSVRRVAAYLTIPVLFTSYLLATILFCIQHSDEQFFDVLRDKETSFFVGINAFTEERWLY